MRILIKNASLVLEDRVEAGDLLTEGRRIVQIGGTIDAPADRVIDAAGCYVFPGFIDTHTHFDLEVGSTVTADDFVTGTKAAVIGGTTTVLDFATQERGMTMMGAFRIDLLSAGIGADAQDDAVANGHIAFFDGAREHVNDVRVFDDKGSVARCGVQDYIA